MTPSADLFDLIKSLSPSEKRYFKLFGATVAGKDESAYMKLFDAIDKMEFYDEAALKEKFKKERFVKQLSVLKNYLLNTIVKSLLHSNSESFPATKLQFDISAIELLYEKGLHKLCYKYISKCKASAYEQQEYTIIDRLCDWETRLLLSELKIDDAKNIVDEQIDTVTQRLNSLKRKRKAIDIFEFTLENDAANKANEYQHLVNEIADNPPQIQNNILENYFHHSSLSMFYSVSKELEKRIFHVKAALNDVEKNQHFVEANFRIYVSLLNNYLNALHEKNDIEEIYHFIKTTKTKILSLNPNLHKASKVMGLIILFNTELLLYINKKNKHLSENVNEEAKQLIHEAQSFIDKFHLLELYRNIIHANFLNSDFENAYYYVNEILKNKEFKNRPDVYYPARIWELILHYEMGNDVLLQNIADSTQKFLKRNNKLTEFDNELIMFLKAHDNEKKEKHLNSLLRFFENDYHHNIEHYSLTQNQLNILNWLKGKMQY